MKENASLQAEIDDLNKTLVSIQEDLHEVEQDEDQSKQMVYQLKSNIAKAEEAIKANLFVCN